MIADNYVSMLFPYGRFIDYFSFGSYSWHSMLDFFKENSDLGIL